MNGSELSNSEEKKMKSAKPRTFASQKSCFKPWIKIAAIITLLVFLPQNAAFAKRSYYQSSQSSLFQDPDAGDQALALGISIAMVAVTSCLGGAGGAGSQTASFGSTMASGIAAGQIAQAATNIGVRQFGMSSGSAQIFGSAVGGALGGGLSQGGFSSWSWSSAGWGAVNGGISGYTQVQLYNAMKNTSFYEKNPILANAVIGLAGSAAGYAGTGALKDMFGAQSAMNVQGNKDKPRQVMGKDQGELGFNGDSKTQADIVTKDSQGRTLSVKETWAGGSKTTNFKDGQISGVGFEINNTGYVNAFGDGKWVNLRMAANNPNFQTSMISQSVGALAEYGAASGWFGKTLQKNPEYARMLGEPLGGVMGAGVTGGNWKTAAWNGFKSGAISVGLNVLGGSYDRETGKNDWGMSKMQMASLTWLGTTAIGGITSGNWKEYAVDSANTLGYNLATFGGSASSRDGWSMTQYGSKINDLAGTNSLKANADLVMRRSGSSDWDDFVDAGGLANAMPSFGYSFVNYVASSMHYASVGQVASLVDLYSNRQEYAKDNHNYDTLMKGFAKIKTAEYWKNLFVATPEEAQANRERALRGWGVTPGEVAQKEKNGSRFPTLAAIWDVNFWHSDKDVGDVGTWSGLIHTTDAGRAEWKAANPGKDVPYFNRPLGSTREGFTVSGYIVELFSGKSPSSSIVPVAAGLAPQNGNLSPAVKNSAPPLPSGAKAQRRLRHQHQRRLRQKQSFRAGSQP